MENYKKQLNTRHLPQNLKTLFCRHNNIIYLEDYGFISSLSKLYKTKTTSVNKLYHILTSPSTFSINGVIIKDYNSCIDFI